MLLSVSVRRVVAIVIPQGDTIKKGGGGGADRDGQHHRDRGDGSG